MRDGILDLLADSPLLVPCTTAELRVISRTADFVRVGAGAVLSSTSEATNPVVLVARGEVHAVRDDGVTTCRDGALYGATEVLARVRRNDHVVTATDAELFLLEPRRLVPLLETCPQLALSLLRQLARNACAA